MKQTFIACLLLLVAGAAQGKQIVWEQPTTEFSTSYGDGFFNLALDITRVELKENETLVYMTVSQRSDYDDYWFQFASGSYLKADGKQYAITSADGIQLDTHQQTGPDGTSDVVLHFEPLPLSTKSFDFTEGDFSGAWSITGIKPVEERWRQLLPSYWRDEKGDWKIAFLEDQAIYDCKFWRYKKLDINQKTGEAEMLLTDGTDDIKVIVGKDKKQSSTNVKGTRTIQIGDQKASYSMITSRFMPDYPQKDTRTDFIDTDYNADTVTVVGWIKDMPDKYKGEKTFEFGYNDIFTGDQKSVYADLDEQGRFKVSFPLLNSTGFFCDWSRCFMRTMLEPGKTYFLLYDFKEGRRYFMGDDCRLQNELFKFPVDWQTVRMERGDKDFDKYIASTDSLLQTQFAKQERLFEEHPSLSTRYRQYRKGHTLWQQAYCFGQARFRGENSRYPEAARRYAYNTFWTKLESPLTLHRETQMFLRDYLGDVVVPASYTFRMNYLDHISEIAENDEEREALNHWKEWAKAANEAVNQASTMEEKQRIANEENAKHTELIEAAIKILNSQKAQVFIRRKGFLSRMKAQDVLLDSLGAKPFLKSIWFAQQVYNQLDNERVPLPEEVMDTMKVMIGNPTAIEMIEKKNDYYVALANREFDKLVLKSSDDVKDLTEGEALLRKLLEPYKGKFVLLDVWGTWCGPCKEALSHSQEEYDRLKDFDIAFLYLANNSPQESWENVIKEYNVSGENVAHYNLPPEQQSAIERHLDVRAFPTYKLFDRDGNMLDLKVDARDLDNLVKLLQQMQ
ncbi:MAG: redoxin family protein [Bacteroidaceae bacterium]|nr:redoxin family protein [Bacteroidaceae bacterium]